MIRKIRCLQSERVYTESKQELDTAQIPHRSSQEEDSAEDSTEDEQESDSFNSTSVAQTADEEDYGEVNKIFASRVVDRGTEYLIEWKDDHPDSWEPAANIARDVITEYENAWWQAARKADEKRLLELLQDEGRNVDAIDENERTALLFASGMGSERCARLLVEAGADVNWQDKDGFTAIHIAAGYVHISVVKILLELGADPDLEDSKGRSALGLAQDLLERTPKANPMQFARRLALDQIVKLLDEALYETVEVEQVLDKRVGESGRIEYLVRWSDDSEQSWVQVGDVGEDLVRDYEAGLEYGIAEKVLEKRLRDGQVEYLVKWADSENNTWEPADNVAAEVIAEFENASSVEEIKTSSER
ncbi:hypothetical protein O6H91_10G101800 [Diphasiastrum complanatum]|nr:hypothetical protein O6H91_10G101800 [Diphasiastrum complanatum]